MYFGAHVSIAGGIFNAPLNAAAIGCEVFQMFTRSPRGGQVSPLTKDVVALFKKNCELTAQREWYIHTPYFIHFASGNNRIAYGSISVVREELERGTILGARYVMTHLGSYKDLGRKNGFIQLVGGLEKTLADYRGKTRLLIEISTGSGEVIGRSFEEIAEIVHHPKLKKYDIGVCLDTQHAFASGYDIRTPKAVKTTLEKFDATIGLDKLRLSHCNDSKVEFESYRDRHEHLGAGFIGESGFAALLSSPRLPDINFVLETEPDGVRQDLKILKEIRKVI